MKCAIIECEKPAALPFKACGKAHGWELKSYWKPLIEKAFDADHNREKLLWYNDMKAQGNNPEKPPFMISMDELEHYSQFIKL